MEEHNEYTNGATPHSGQAASATTPLERVRELGDSDVALEAVLESTLRSLHRGIFDWHDEPVIELFAYSRARAPWLWRMVEDGMYRQVDTENGARQFPWKGDARTDYRNSLDAYLIQHPELAPPRPSSSPSSEPVYPPLFPPRLDEAALYGLAGDIVRAIAPHTEADPVALLIQTLVFFGNSLGRAAYYTVEADRHYLNLYTVLVGDSAKARKGTSAGHILRLFRDVDEVWVSRCLMQGLSSGEGLIWEVHDEVRKWHASKQEYVVIEPTVEDKRRCILESEFVSVLRVLERDGNILSPVLRQAWDGKPLRVMTKNSPAQATGAHISLVGHITAEELRRYLTRTEMANGLGNRFLWLAVRRSKLLPDGGHLDPHTLSPLIRRLQIALLKARQSTCLERSTEARDMWHSVYGALSAERSGLVGALMARAEAQVLRLQCLYALLDETTIITAEHLYAALALWQYCEGSIQYIFASPTGVPLADRILAFLDDEPEGLTRTELNNRLGRNKSAAEIEDALSQLTALGYITVEKAATGGRPVEYIRIKREVEKNEKTK